MYGAKYNSSFESTNSVPLEGLNKARITNMINSFLPAQAPTLVSTNVPFTFADDGVSYRILVRLKNYAYLRVLQQNEDIPNRTGKSTNKTRGGTLQWLSHPLLFQPKHYQQILFLQ